MNAVHHGLAKNIPARSYAVHAQWIIISGQLRKLDLIRERKFSLAQVYIPYSAVSYP